MNSRTFAIGGILTTIVFASVPFVKVYLSGPYHGVPPALVDDDLYYYARMREVADGNFEIGNPFFREHADASSVAFSISDWLAAIPLMIGVSLTSTIIINHLVWSVITVILLFILLRLLGAPRYVAGGIALFGYLEVYWLLLRPVVMQQVFPFFILFLLSYLYWSRSPRDSRAIMALISTSALAFYIYGFLWQIIFCILAVTFLERCWRRQWHDVKILARVAVGVAALASPILVYMLFQFSDAQFWETYARIGVVATHVPSLDALLYGRWIALVLVACGALRAWLRQNRDQLIIIASGLLIAGVSPVIVGSDIATGQHVGRFITLIVALIVPLTLYDIWIQRDHVRELHWWRVVVASASLALCAMFLLNNLPRATSFLRVRATAIQEVQQIAAPLQWLQEHEHSPSVVVANETVSAYIPILTRHNVVWSHAGSLYKMKSQEAQDRYFAATFTTHTRQTMLESLGAFQGAGVERRFADMGLRQQLRCWFKIGCEEPVTLMRWYGEAQLDALVGRYNFIAHTREEWLRRFHASYIIVDRAHDDYPQSFLKLGKIVWSNDYFNIYQLI